MSQTCKAQQEANLRLFVREFSMFYTEHDAFRPADWRYRRADFLRTQRRYTRRGKDDDYVRMAQRFLKMRDKVKQPWDEEKLAYNMPGLFYAHRLYQRSDQMQRYIVEARVLSGQTPAEIAEKTHQSAEVVFWYEKIFFDVRDKMHHRDWLILSVLGPSFHRGVMARDYDILLKLYALIGGPVVVDAMVEQTSGAMQRPRTGREMNTFYNTDTSESLRRSAAIAARTMPVTLNTQLAIIEAHHRLLDLEKQEEQGPEAQQLLVTNIQAALQQVPFFVEARQPQQQRSEFKPFDELAVELRSRELVATGVGVDLDLSSKLEPFKFPELPASTVDGNPKAEDVHA